MADPANSFVSVSIFRCGFLLDPQEVLGILKGGRSAYRPVVFRWRIAAGQLTPRCEPSTEPLNPDLPPDSGVDSPINVLSV